MSNKTEKANKHEICNAKVVDHSFYRGKKCRAVHYNGKKMLFMSELEKQFKGIPFKNYLEETPVRINVTQALPGVRDLIPLDTFGAAMKKWVDASFSTTDKDAKPVKSVHQAEQWELPISTNTPVTEKQAKKESLKDNSTDLFDFEQEQDIKIDFSNIGTVYDHTVDSGTVKPRTRKEELGDYRASINSKVQNYISRYCEERGIKDDSDPNARKERSRVFGILYEKIDNTIAPYLLKKYGKSLDALNLGPKPRYEKVKNNKSPGYLQILEKFDYQYNENILKSLLAITKEFIPEPGKLQKATV